jgi:predicted Zn-dependent protease
MNLSEKEARRICQNVLASTKAEDAAVSVSSETLSHLRFAANGFTTSGNRRNLRVYATVWIDQKQGAAATNETDEASLKELVREAERLARLSPIDKEYLPTLRPQKYKPVHGYVEATEKIPVATRARSINQILQECERAKVIGAGFHSASAVVSASATKNGNFNYERSSLVSLAVTARTPDGSSSGYFLRSHFDAGKLNVLRIGQEAIRKAVESRDARTLEAGDYSVILEPQATADLLGPGLGGVFNARSAEEGRSAFSASGGKTRLGQKIFDERIHVYSDPWHPEVPGSADAQDGIPAQKIYLVRNGVLENLVYSRFWASKQGKNPTPGPVNTIFESTAKPAPLEEMIKATTRGLLIGRFWYIRLVDPRTVLLTGLTRDGVWYIENGRIQYPVRNFRFNQSIIQMIAPGNVEMIGASERVGTSEGGGRNPGFFPSLKLRSFHMASQSEAV